MVGETTPTAPKIPSGAVIPLSEAVKPVLHAGDRSIPGVGLVLRPAEGRSPCAAVVVVRFAVRRSSSIGSGASLRVGGLFPRLILFYLFDLVADADDIGFILRDPRRHRGVLKGDRRANFGFIFGAYAFAGLKLYADVLGFIHVRAFGR